MSLEHPAWGCNRLSDWLKLDGVSVGAPTIQSDIPVATILTDNGREFCGREEHPFELYLALNDIEQRRTKVRHPFTNGFVERFHGTVLDEFFRTAFRQVLRHRGPTLQADLDEWLAYYNTERPHQGYRNQGRRPIDTINDYLARPVEAPASPLLDPVPVRDDG